MKKSILRKLLFLVTAAMVLTWFLPTAVFAAVPNAPTGLIAVTVNAGRVDLHWTDNSLDETGFSVERAPDIGGLEPGTYAAIGPNPTVPGTATTGARTYSDTTVMGSQGYWYRVRAVNASGSSLPSNEVGIRMPPSAPQISLTSSATLLSGVSNTIEATATDPGGTVASADYQFIANNAPGTFTAHDIYSAPKDLTILAPRAGSPVADTTTMPAGIPAGAIAEFEIRGTVSAVNTGTGEWKIGTPPFTVYESVTGQAQSTKFVGSRLPVVGDAVKIIAYRTTAIAGPLVAREIRFIRAAQPAGTPAFILSFLYNGTVTAINPPVTDVGYLISGETWTIGTGNFRTDDPDFPAYIDLDAQEGTNVAVRFVGPPAVKNIARQIMTQLPPTVLTTKHPDPVFDTTPIPVPGNLPPGTWLYMVLDGVCTAVNHDTGEWVLGTEQVKAYEHGLTWVMQHPIINWPPGVGDELLLFGKRTLTPGPIVLDEAYMILQGPLATPPKGTTVETHLMYNGVVEAMGPNTWTVGGQTFIVDDPEGRARIDPMPMPSFKIGDSVTVEFEHVGEVLPDDANWAPMALDAGTGKWTGDFSPPPVPGGQSGSLFLRVTDATQTGSTAAVASTLDIPPSVPNGPTGLSAVVFSGSQVNLTWTDTSSDEVNFRIERAPNSGGSPGTWSTLATTAGPGIQAYSDMTVSPSTTYYYRVVAVNAAGPSSPSNIALVTTVPPPAKVAFITPARTINADLASLVITVQSQDAAGNPANVSGDIAVNLTSNSGTGLFDTSAVGPFTTTSVIIASGTNSVSFYYKDATIGAPTITATPAALTASQQMETIVAAGAPSQIGFISAPQTVEALVASENITVQTQDGAGTPVNVAADTVVNLSSSSAAGLFALSAAGPFNVTSVTIPAGSNTARFNYKDTISGTPTITAAATGLNNGSQTETITPAAPTKVAFTTQPSGAAAGLPFTTQPVVTVQDAAGNTAATYAGDVTVAIKAGTGNAGAVLSGTLTVTAVDGVATFTGLSIDLNGNGYRLDATSGALTPATSNAFNVLSAPQTVNVELWSGWNLVSPPVIPTNTSRASVLSNISGSIISVWAFDAAAGTWSSWNPIIGGDLTTIRDGKGYWINMNSAATLPITGMALPAPPVLPPTYSVAPGWNLIGFKNTAPNTVGAYLTGCNFRYPVYGFKNGAYFTLSSGTGNLEPGLGYWTYFDAAGIVTP